MVALVQIDGEKREMVFFDQQPAMESSQRRRPLPCRWQIEVFFKQIKQTLQLADFLGHNANAVRWQVWIALLVYALLRYLSFVSKWAHSFTRLFTIVRAVLWSKSIYWICWGAMGQPKVAFRNFGAARTGVFPGFL